MTLADIQSFPDPLQPTTATRRLSRNASTMSSCRWYGLDPRTLTQKNFGSSFALWISPTASVVVTIQDHPLDHIRVPVGLFNEVC